MINPYFVQIAAVRLAARLCGKPLYENYAFHGALARFCSIDAGEIHEADGIDDVPQKEASFRFGQKCGKALLDAFSGLNEEDILFFNARVARETFLCNVPDAGAEEAAGQVKTILRALFKKAQIRTHTAKPGSEDIEGWLAKYYALEQDFETSLDAFARAAILPKNALEARTATFFDADDPLIVLALGADELSAQDVAKAAAAPASSLFGKVLRESIR